MRRKEGERMAGKVWERREILQRRVSERWHLMSLFSYFPSFINSSWITKGLLSTGRTLRFFSFYFTLAYLFIIQCAYFKIF